MSKTLDITIEKTDAENAGIFYCTGGCLLATIGKRLFPDKIVSAGGDYFRVRDTDAPEAVNTYYTMPREASAADFYDVDREKVDPNQFPLTLTFTVDEF